MQSRQDQRLRDLVATVIELHKDQARISPTWVATQAMHDLDSDRRIETDHVLIWTGCHLQFRQIARQILAKHFKNENDQKENELFPGLQWRYPTAHSAEEEEPEYVLREHMSSDDVVYNVVRLRAEAGAKMQHANALEAWGQSRGLCD